MQNKSSTQQTNPDHETRFFRDVLIGLFAAGSVISICIYFYVFQNSQDVKELGANGDFIGGTLNPLLTYLSFSGILVSIYLQRLDLSLSRKELIRSADALEMQITSIEKQNFETAFFQMLSAFNSIVASTDLYNKESGAETSGRDCFVVFYTRLNKIYRETKEKARSNHTAEGTLRLSYYNFWKVHQPELGHYFRFLYNIFRFLEQSPVSEEHHVKLLRAQLSDQELLLLFYNCNTVHGANFLKYAIKYKLFDNLPTIRLLEDSHVQLVDRTAFGNNPMYNSKNIRDSAK